MDVVLYNTDDGKVGLDVRLDRETVWLNQRQMAELFDKDTDTVGLHIRNIYNEGELSRDGTTEESSVVQNEGGRQVRRNVQFYNLDIVISVGYRIKSRRGTQFRQWATRVLREHLVKGFTLNEQRLREQNQKLSDDGNKRIGAALFITFLAGNRVLYRGDGSKRIADNALIALTLLIATSHPEQKEIIVNVIVNLINRANE